MTPLEALCEAVRRLQAENERLRERLLVPIEDEKVAP